MEIRVMNIDDYDKVYELWKETSGMGLNTTDDSKDGISKYLSRNPNTCFVAEKNHKIVGVIMSGHDGRRGYIYHVAVKISERKEGIGRALLNKAMTALEAEGISKVALVVFEKNVIGNAFWEKNEFTTRNDLIYRNKNIVDLVNIDT